jgi:amidophosphoribosyltransferase
VNATELAAKLINEGPDITRGIEHMFRKIKGSCSLLMLHKDGVYAARDRLGYTPLVIGRRDDDWAITSESSSFPNIGFKVVKNLLPGEITLINEKGPKGLKDGSKANQICAFLWIYTGFPASSYEGINVEVVRERCGGCLARRDKVKADFAAGVPDSGTTHAIGYAMESGLPFRRPLVKYTPGYGRSYTPPSQAIRDRVAKMKLIAIREIIEKNCIIMCEDSIVRGTQLKNFTIQKLWENHAREVHIRPACPPLMFPCKYNLSTRSVEELAARRAITALEGAQPHDVSEYVDQNSKKHKKMVDWIANDLGVTTLQYQKLDDMVSAIGLSANSLCLYCWTGEGA